MIIDAHAHSGDGLGREWRAEELLDLMTRHSIDRACVSSTESLRGDPAGNRNVLRRFLRPHPSRFVGLCVANPHQRPLDEVSWGLENGFVGIKLHPAMHECRLDRKEYDPVLRLASRQRRPVLIHCGGSPGDPDRFAPPDALLGVLERYPDLPLLIGHMGMDWWRDLIDLVAPFPNARLGISSSLPQRERLPIAVERIGSGRIVFGTDMPFLDPSLSLGLVQGAGLPDEDRTRILSGNISGLLERATA